MNLRHYLLQFHTPQTTDSYLRSIHHFLDYSIKKEHSSYADVLRYAHKKSITTRDLSAFKKYFDYHIYMGSIVGHPCKSLIIKSKKKAIQHQDLLSREELESLLNRPERYKELQTRNKLIIGLLIYQQFTSNVLIDLWIC